MKKKLIALLLAVMLVLSVLSVAACDKKWNCAKKGHKFPEGSCTCTECGTTEHDFNADGVCTRCGVAKSLVDYRAYIAYDLKTLSDAIGSLEGDAGVAVKAAYDAGLAAIEEGKSVAEVKGAYAAARTAMINAVPKANGAFNFSGLSVEEKTKILGLVEAYGIRNGLLGMTLFENGNYVMYNDRIVLGTENYISGYGFGTLAEGSIKSDLASENKAEWKRYYHTINAADPGTANYLNDKGSEVSDFYGYIGASYFTNFMNAEKDGYDWVPELAVTNPEPVEGLNADGLASKWRFEIRSGLKYNTLSTKADRASFNNREIAMEDYLTPFKLLLNQANGYYRGSELAGQKGAAAIVGAKAYYEATKNAEKGILSDTAADFSKVALKVYEEGGKWYFEYELAQPTTMFYARYYISSSLYMPVPKDFIDAVGVENYLGFNKDKSYTPVDNALSLGAYTLELWDSGQQVVYKKNPNYVYATTKYAVEGVHINILTAAKDDPEASIKEFLAGKTDSTGIPSTRLSEFKSDPRTRTALGQSCFKLNMNALSQKDWNKMFGTNGDVWQCEPALSNAHFRQALSYSFNRVEFADLKGCIPSANYFSAIYLSDPENGISYNATAEHKNAISGLLADTDGYGYSLELAREYFRIALAELEADGAYTPGTVDNPTVIELQIAWQTASNETAYHKYVKQYFETAFNDPSVTGGKYKLECTFWVGANWYDVYYDKILVGQFDLGFGSISGNPMNPLDFLTVCSSDQALSQEMTLNWAIDTNDPLAEALVYDGKLWSFDALLKAAMQPTIVKDGANVSAYSAEVVEQKDEGEDKVVTIKISYQDAVAMELTDIVAYAGDKDAYNEFSVLKNVIGEIKKDEVAHTITFTVKVTAAQIAELPENDNQGIDLKIKWTLLGNTTESVESLYVPFHA